MSNLQSKRFVVRKSLIGKNQIIEVTFKSGKTFTYNHDIVYDLMKSKLETMNCFIKYNLILLQLQFQLYFVTK